MPRRLPNGNDDEQLEDSQVTNIARRRRNLPARYGPGQNIQDIQNTPARLYSDEHPEVPKVRRASRRIDESTLPDTSMAATVRTPTTKNRSVRPPTASMPAVRPSSTEKIPAIEHAEYTDHTEYTDPETEHDFYQDSEALLPSTGKDPRRTSKIIVSRARRRHPVYEPPQAPPPAHYRPRGRHRPRTVLSILQDISHNQTLLLVGSIVLVGLILLPILISVIWNAAHPQSSTLITGGVNGQSNGQSGQTGVNAPPVDPHEIVIVPPTSDHPAPPVYATSAYLLDADTGATFYAHNPFLHLPMMSTTKLMTATLAIQQGNLDRRVTINDNIANDLGTLSADSSLMGIKKGETYTLRDLLYGLLLVSGNDAAIAIADTVSGNLPNFVAQMNQKAAQLGLHDTHYMNPHGLLATGHYSSAHDLAILGRYSMSLPDLHKISGTKEYSITQSNDHPSHFLINGNQFLWWYPGVDGGKPGWDNGSNFVQVVSVTRNGHHLIGVTMHTADWWTDMRDLMNWGFNDFTWISPYDVDIAHPPIPFDYDWNYFVKDKKTNTIPTVNQGRYYIYSGYSINGPIMSYFDANGGLNKFGYPTGGLLAAGGTTVSQAFERGVVQCDTGNNNCKTI